MTSLVENYLDLQAKRTRRMVQVRLLDVEVATRQLPPLMRRVLFYHGVAQWTTRDVARRMGVSHTYVQDAYANAIGRIVNFLNGETNQEYE